MNWESFLRYVLIPFPSATGFSAYRMPGPAAHVGFMALMFFLGSALCFGAGIGWPGFAVWLVAGCYLGRDLTIGAHYSAFIALPGIGLFVTLLLGVTFLNKTFVILWESLHAVAQEQPAFALASTTLVAGLQALALVAAARAPRS